MLGVGSVIGPCAGCIKKLLMECVYLLIDTIEIGVLGDYCNLQIEVNCMS